MKIAMVSVGADPRLACGHGAEAGEPDRRVGRTHVQVLGLATALVRDGHKVVVYTRRESAAVAHRTRLPYGVEVEQVPAGPVEPLDETAAAGYADQFVEILTAALRRRPFDVVHSHGPLSGRCALRAAAAAGLPVVHSRHADGAPADGAPADRDPADQGLADGLAAGRVPDTGGHGAPDRILASCTDELFELVRRGVPRSAVTVVTSGVDTRLFGPDGAVAERGRQPRLLMVGDLDPKGGAHTAISALRAVRGAELLIAGGPAASDLVDDPDAGRLLAVASGSRVGDRVKLLGAVGRVELPALLRSADVVVCPAWQDRCGMAVLEAMACGVPVVAAASGAPAEVVLDGSTGLLVPPRRPDALARAVRSVLADARLGASLGRAGVERVRRRYGWERVAGLTLRAYQRTAPGRDRVGRDRPATG
jgi:glycosyltransferase involved in cell wall biosynthesis